MRRTWTVALFACAALSQAFAARADGVILEGVSARTLGRGGTNLGHADNGALVHDNPAGLVNLCGDELLDVGAVVLVSDFGYSDPFNDVSASAVTPLPQVAYVRKSCDGVWAWGLGVFTSAGFTEEYEMEGPAPFFPGQRDYESFGSLTKVLPAVSCRLTDNLSIGGTLGVGICHAELEGPYFLQGPGGLTGFPVLLDTQGTGATPVWSLGLQYRLSERTTIGAAYLSESSFNLHGKTNVNVFGVGRTTYDSELEVTWPRSLGVGMRHETGPRSALSADLMWYDWSSAFDEFVLKLRNPAVAGFPETDDHFPLRWRDTVSARLGYEWLVASGGTMRLGYVYHRNPIPNDTLTPFIQATLEHSVSVGYGWCCRGWEIDLSYMFLFGPDRTVDDSAFVGDDFDNSRHEAAVHAINVGFMKRL